MFPAKFFVFQTKPCVLDEPEHSEVGGVPVLPPPLPVRLRAGGLALQLRPVQECLGPQRESENCVHC
jgi:hypothetical protein